MPWVCTCGQRNIVDGLPCLACDLMPKSEPNPVKTFSFSGGARFRDEPEDLLDDLEESSDEPASAGHIAPSAPIGRRFRFSDDEDDVDELAAEIRPAAVEPVRQQPTAQPKASPPPAPEYEPAAPAPTAAVAASASTATPAAPIEPEAPIVDESIYEEAWKDTVSHAPDGPSDDGAAGPASTWYDFDLDVDDVAPSDGYVDEAPVPEPVVEPVVESSRTPVVASSPFIESALDPVVDSALFDEPIIEDQELDELIFDEPVLDEPVLDEPVLDEPEFDEPVLAAPVVDHRPLGEDTSETTETESPDSLVDDDEDDPWALWNSDASDSSVEWPQEDRRQGGRRSEDQPAEPVAEARKGLPLISESTSNKMRDPWAELRGEVPEYIVDEEPIDESEVESDDRAADDDDADSTSVTAANAFTSAPLEPEIDYFALVAPDEDDSPALEDFAAAFPSPWVTTETEQPMALTDALPPAESSAKASDPLVGASPEPPVTDASALTSWDDWANFEPSAEPTVSTAGLSVDSWDQLPAVGEFDWDSVLPPTNVVEPEPAAEPALGAEGAAGEADDDEPEWDESAYDGWVLDENGEWVEAPDSTDDRQSTDDESAVDESTDEWGSGSWNDHDPVAAAPAIATSISGENEVDEDSTWWLDNATLGNVDADAITGNAYVDKTQSLSFDEDDDDDFFADTDATASRAAFESAYDVNDLFSDADLDEPDEFEIDEDEWAMVSEPSRPTSKNQKPKKSGEQRNRRADSRSGSGPKRSTSKGSNNSTIKVGGFNVPNVLNLNASKLITAVLAVVAIIVLSMLFKQAFDRVSAAPSATPTVAASCQTQTTSQVKSAASLSSAMLVAPKGWTQIDDRVADTGAIDFATALKNEPNPATALASLDQTRFQNGFSRSYKNGAITATVKLYQFGGPQCANDYVNLHAKDAAKATFDVASVGSVATGQVVAGDKTNTYVVRAARDNRVEVISWTGDAVQAHATAGVSQFGASEYSVLGS